MKIIILSIILSFSIPLENITNGVYNFQIDKNKFLVFEKGKLKIGNSKKCQKESNFRIKIKSIYNIFYIEHKQTNFKLTVTKSDLTISITGILFIHCSINKTSSIISIVFLFSMRYFLII